MCIKLAETEIGTVKALMAMSLNAIIADVFDVDFDDFSLSTNLETDLHMDKEKESDLSELVREYFDGLTVDFRTISTVEDLFNIVVQQDFEDIPDNAF